MKLLRLKAEGFGALRGEYLFDPDRVAILVDDNERGKSTLLCAIAAALYGLESDRRSHRPLTPLERWRPWDGGPYAVELDLECGGTRTRIERDFAKGTVRVLDGEGRDVTAEFRNGKDDYPVGAKLLGLDVEEFEKCALVRQGDLPGVVPSDEKERRQSTLRSRLETAADVRVGDTNASDVLRLLEGALRRYTCAELDFTGTVEHAIQRLASKQALLETELGTLDHDRALLAGPLEELADMGESEREVRASIDTLDREWRVSLAEDARRKLEEDREHRAELEALRNEAATLAGASRIAPDAESRLRDVVARLEEAQRNAAALENRRSEQITSQRAALEREREGLAAFEAGGAAEADRCVSLAAEIRRVAEDEARLRDDIFNLRESLATEGHDPGRLQWLDTRLGRLTESDHALLRRQSELALAHHTEAAILETQRTQSSEALREIDAQRNRWALPGWFLLALGVSALVAGSVVIGLKGLPVLSWTFVVTGSLLLGSGVALVLYGKRLRADEREDALRTLSDSQRRLNHLRQQRAETETNLEALARQLGYRDSIELLREWNELVRLRDESGPAVQAQQQLAALDQRRVQALAEGKDLLATFRISTVDPDTLDKVAAFLRRLESVRTQLKAVDRPSWYDEQRLEDEPVVAGFRERALRILRDAELPYDPERSWAEHVEELADRVRAGQRWRTLTEELIPLAERRILSEGERDELEGQLALAEESQGESARRGAVEFGKERRALEERLQEIQRRRTDLRVQVEEAWRRQQSERPEKQIQLEKVERALARARRFQDAVELARRTVQEVAAETHQRWADFLNQRVAEMLGPLSGTIEQIRFGDDLDFSLKIRGGPSLPRGKADQQLSAGARDQLYLVLRLAASEFLSRGRSRLPFLLDDVFATSDDVRARAGMRLLLERLSREHQVILVTCHRERSARLAALDHDLYQSRVQWLEAPVASMADPGARA